MFSIVIRNKNEAEYLEKVLNTLRTIYKEDIDEIILVDNNSTDQSLEVAKRYNCKIVTITNFSYGRAINMGIEAAKNNYVLLLSSHSVPVGTYFFKSTLAFLNSKPNVAGLRYINSYQNYERALQNNFLVKEPLKFGLMAACAVVVKSVWEQHKFNEELGFSEDKEWSQRVTNAGFNIFNMNETFFYFIKRNKAGLVNRFKSETLAYHQLFNVKSPSKLKIIGSFFKKALITNTKTYFGQLITDFKKAKAKLEIHKKLK
ncbi:glycosyltransferase family 2 protein [Lacinutrix salivirga]